MKGIDWHREPTKPWWAEGDRILVHRGNDGRRKTTPAVVLEVKRHATKVRQEVDDIEFHIRHYEGFPLEEENA